MTTLNLMKPPLSPIESSPQENASNKGNLATTFDPLCTSGNESYCFIVTPDSITAQHKEHPPPTEPKPKISEMDWSTLFKTRTPTREKKRQLNSAKWPGHVLPPIVPNITEVEIKGAHVYAAMSAREASKLLFRDNQTREIKIIPSTKAYNLSVEPMPFNLAAFNDIPGASRESAGRSEWK